MSRSFVFLVLPLGAACGGSLSAPPALSRTDAGAVSSAAAGEGFETTVNATRSDAWVFLDLDAHAEVPVDDPSWDLAFQRAKVKSNGGISGSMGVEVALVPDVDLPGVPAAPNAGWRVDQADGPDMDAEADTVFNRGDDTWYAYDLATHTLSPRRRVYVVRSGAGGYFALQLTRYYDAAGSAGFVSFRWRAVPAPALKMPAQP